ncbi:MAG: PD-(D/E)XK nuclease family protein [Halorientalis sp.]
MAQEEQLAQLRDRLGHLETAINQTALEDLESELSELETSIERIPSPTRPPKTTLQVQNQADMEEAWQNYLAYFLDPEEPHGLGVDALNRVLRGLHEYVDEGIPEYAPENVVVRTERQSKSGNRPDIIVYAPERFFICWELKLYSSEGDEQTIRYAEDDHVGQIPKAEVPEQGRHYVYLKRPGQADAEAAEFRNLTWTQIREWLTPLVTTTRGRYPTRTTAQLTDFLETIHHGMTEDDHLSAEREKMQLYFNHEEAIRQARKGLETVHDHEKQNWRRRFIADYLPETWNEGWHCNSNVYGQIYHSTWRQDDGLDIDDAQVRMHFVHLIRNLDSFEDGKLTIQLRWPGESAYRERFKELFVSDKVAVDLDPHLAEHDINKRADYSYNNPRFTEKVYPVVKTDLPESYYETLTQAVSEHLTLGQVINEILETAIADVENGDT